MRFGVRLMAGIWIASLAVIAGFAWGQVADERQRLTRELTQRAALVGDGLKEAVEPALGRGQKSRVERLVRTFSRPDQSIAVYDRVGAPVAAAGPLGDALPGVPPEVIAAIADGEVRRGFS